MEQPAGDALPVTHDIHSTDGFWTMLGRQRQLQQTAVPPGVPGFLLYLTSPVEVGNNQVTSLASALSAVCGDDACVPSDAAAPAGSWSGVSPDMVTRMLPIQARFDGPNDPVLQSSQRPAAGVDVYWTAYTSGWRRRAYSAHGKVLLTVLYQLSKHLLHASTNVVLSDSALLADEWIAGNARAAAARSIEHVHVLVYEPYTDQRDPSSGKDIYDLSVMPLFDSAQIAEELRTVISGRRLAALSRSRAVKRTCGACLPQSTSDDIALQRHNEFNIGLGFPPATPRAIKATLPMKGCGVMLEMPTLAGIEHQTDASGTPHEIKRRFEDHVDSLYAQGFITTYPLWQTIFSMPMNDAVSTARHVTAYMNCLDYMVKLKLRYPVIYYVPSVDNGRARNLLAALSDPQHHIGSARALRFQEYITQPISAIHNTIQELTARDAKSMEYGALLVEDYLAELQARSAVVEAISLGFLCSPRGQDRIRSIQPTLHFLPQCTRLRVIHLHVSWMKDVATASAVLEPLSRCRRLEHLWLDCRDDGGPGANYVDNAFMTSLLNLLSTMSCVSLHFTSMQLKPHMPRIMPLPAYSAVRQLRLQDVDPDLDFDVVAGVLKEPACRWTHLSVCCILLGSPAADQWVALLADALTSNTSLVYLQYVYNFHTLGNLPHLAAALRQNTSLRALLLARGTPGAQFGLPEADDPDFFDEQTTRELFAADLETHNHTLVHSDVFDSWDDPDGGTGRRRPAIPAGFRVLQRNALHTRPWDPAVEGLISWDITPLGMR